MAARPDRRRLILVPGAGNDEAVWHPVSALLSDRFQPVPLPRTPGAGFAAEAAEVVAKSEAGGPGVVLAGYSGGAVVALEAVALGAEVDRLVLYEPPLLVGRPPYRQDDLLAEMRRALEEGRHDDAVEAFQRRAAGLTDDEIGLARQGPGWERLARNVPVLLEALATSREYVFTPQRFTSVRVPVLLLVGERTTPMHRASVVALAEVLPEARVARVADAGHLGVVTRSRQVAAEILDFV